jgi:hypothetical protein
MLSPPWIIIILVGTALCLTVLAVVAKARAAKPKKADRREKAQILKQLLALSEGKDGGKGISRQQSLSQVPTRRSRSAAASTSRSRAARA